MVVVVVGDRRYNVNTRVATIVTWMLVNADEIERHETLKLEIDCGGQNVVAKKTAGEKLKPVA
jgi:hypothetical protein